jgi:hypothetical protein
MSIATPGFWPVRLQAFARHRLWSKSCLDGIHFKIRIIFMKIDRLAAANRTEKVMIWVTMIFGRIFFLGEIGWCMEIQVQLIMY